MKKERGLIHTIRVTNNFLLANFPFERGEILFSKGFFDFSDIRKLQDKAKTSYTLSTRRPRFDYENSLAEVHPELVSEWSEENLPLIPSAQMKKYGGVELTYVGQNINPFKGRHY